MMFQILFGLSFFLSVKCAPGDTCQTPAKKSGSCIPVQECSNLLDIINSKLLNDQQVQFLRESQCGVLNRVVHVCCATSNGVLVRQSQPTDTMSLLPTVGTCGAASTDRIIGGERTKVDEFPWTALVQYLEVRTKTLLLSCGGSLINKRYVLTAAHCVISKNQIPDRYKPVTVRLGEWDTDTETDCDISLDGDQDCADFPVQNIPIEATIPHANFDFSNSQNDIALIRMAHDCQYNDIVKPICLPVTSQLRQTNLDGNMLIATGWGRTETSKPSNLKLKVSLRVVPLQTCQSIFPSRSLWTKQMCAGDVAGKDVCNGDSGGPLMKFTTEKQIRYYYLAGVVSFGPKQCGKEGKPGVFTKVSEYIDWILENIKN